MVFYFSPRGHEAGKDDFLIYMGRDKYENEDLIKYSLPHDIWFHVDDLSSAHVYLRLPQGSTMDSIPADTLEDAAQLVKANSIQGSKLSTVDVVYTPASNLKKTASMDVGQVGFHDPKQVRKMAAPRKAEAVNRLTRTKEERPTNLAAEHEAWEKGERSRKRAEEQVRRSADQAAKEEQHKAKELREYRSVMTADSMVTARELGEKYATAQDYEDDFM